MSQELRQEATKAWNYAKKVADETKSLIDKYSRSAKAIDAAKRWQDLSNVFAAEWKAWADKTDGYWSNLTTGSGEYQTIVTRGSEIAMLYMALREELLAKRKEILARDAANGKASSEIKKEEQLAKTNNDAAAPGAATPGGVVGGPAADGFLDKLRNLPAWQKGLIALVVVGGVAWAAGAFKGTATGGALQGLRRRRRRR